MLLGRRRAVLSGAYKRAVICPREDVAGGLAHGRDLSQWAGSCLILWTSALSHEEGSPAAGEGSPLGKSFQVLAAGVLNTNRSSKSKQELMCPRPSARQSWLRNALDDQAPHFKKLSPMFTTNYFFLVSVFQILSPSCMQYLIQLSCTWKTCILVTLLLSSVFASGLTVIVPAVRRAWTLHVE